MQRQFSTRHAAVADLTARRIVARRNRSARPVSSARTAILLNAEAWFTETEIDRLLKVKQIDNNKTVIRYLKATADMSR